MNRPRKVFGRKVITHESARYRIELRADGLYVRKVRSRKLGWKRIPFSDIATNYLGQALLPL